MEKLIKNICVNSFQFKQEELQSIKFSYTDLTSLVESWKGSTTSYPISDYTPIYVDDQLVSNVDEHVNNSTYENFVNALIAYRDNTSTDGYFFLYSLMYKKSSDTEFAPQALLGYIQQGNDLYEYFLRNDTNESYNKCPFIFKVENIPINVIEVEEQNNVTLTTPEFVLNASATSENDPEIEGKSFDAWKSQHGFKTLDHEEINSPYLLPYNLTENDYSIEIAPYACFKLTYQS